MEIKPHVVQVEAHPYYPQTKLKEILAQTDMALMAWYPLGHGDKTLIEQPIFSKLGKKYGKTNAQIILRWHVQSGNIVIPGSKNPAHIRDNFDIFNFSLTDEEMAEIAKLDKNVRYYNATPEMIEAYSKMELKKDIRGMIRMKEKFEGRDSMVYDLADIQRMLKIGCTASYDFIAKVYKEGNPFPVLRVGSMYRIPKEKFDMWLSGK